VEVAAFVARTPRSIRSSLDERRIVRELVSVGRADVAVMVAIVGVSTCDDHDLLGHGTATADGPTVPP
jgi:hypothetical protein